ncbi:hypothetical protein CAJAP_03755 [Camponotus japonicus]
MGEVYKFDVGINTSRARHLRHCRCMSCISNDRSGILGQDGSRVAGSWSRSVRVAVYRGVLSYKRSTLQEVPKLSLTPAMGYNTLISRALFLSFLSPCESIFKPTCEQSL